MRCNQKHLGTQWPSVAISGHQWPSQALSPAGAVGVEDARINGHSDQIACGDRAEIERHHHALHGRRRLRVAELEASDRDEHLHAESSEVIRVHQRSSEASDGRAPRKE